MNILVVVFIFLGYGTFTALYNLDADPNGALEFPTLELPTATFEDIPPSCSGFVDCLEYVGNVIKNAIIAVIFLVQLIVALLIFLVELIALLAASAISGFEGAPTWFNGLFVAIIAVMLGVMIYRGARKGDVET